MLLVLHDENRRKFFDRVHSFQLPYHEGAILIARAYQDSKKGFEGKSRKSGERYFEHCRRVAIYLMTLADCRDPDTISAALLHDHIEDLWAEGWTLRRISDRYNKNVAEYVRALSMPRRAYKTRERRMAAYHAQIMRAPPQVSMIKLADRLDNLLTCCALTRESQIGMITETEDKYLSLADKLGVFGRELRLAITEAKARLLGEGETTTSAPTS
jgi:GTP pyrophosphokinase